MHHRVGVLLYEPVSILLTSDELRLSLHAVVGEHKDGIYHVAEVGRLAVHTHPVFSLACSSRPSYDLPTSWCNIRIPYPCRDCSDPDGGDSFGSRTGQYTTGQSLALECYRMRWFQKVCMRYRPRYMGWPDARFGHCAVLGDQSHPETGGRRRLGASAEVALPRPPQTWPV